MDKALEIGKASATGSFYLLLGVAGSTVIMAIGTLILAALLPVEGLGLYGIAFIPSAIISFFRDWGINSALTQKIASLRVSGQESQIHDVIVSGVIFEIVSGAILAVICFGVAWPLALVLSPANAQNLSIYISILSISVFAGAVLAAAGGIFIGFERMSLNSFTQVLQAIVKVSLGPLLVILGFGVLGAVYAATISILIGAVVSIIIVYFAFFRQLREFKVGKCDVKETLKPMLKFGLPLTVANIVIGVLPQVFAFTMAVYAGDWMMGNYYAAAYFSVLLTFISFPISTVLFPVFSKLNPEKEPGLIKTVFASSVKYTSLLLVPATMILITLAAPLVNTLFPKDGIIQSFFVANATPKFPYAPLFLMLSSVVNLFVLFGNISLGTLQTGVKKTGQVMKQCLLSLAVGLPLAYFLVKYFAAFGGPSIAVVGGIIGSLVASTPGMVWGLVWIWKNYGVKADFRVSAKIFLASMLASVVTYMFINLFAIWLEMVAVGIAVFLLTYLTSAILIGAINQMDIDNFVAMLSGLGIVSKGLNAPLMLMRKLCKSNQEKELPNAD